MSKFINVRMYMLLDDCFSDGELALRHGNTLQGNTGHKKISRRRNKVHVQCRV